MKLRRRAFMLIMALFMVTFIAVLALAFLGTGAAAFQGAQATRLEQQALALAYSGIEDARVKLERDPLFPPSAGEETKFYSYSETVRDLTSGPVVGSFEVTVDQTYQDSPYFLIRLLSIGRIPNSGKEIKKSVKVEIDISPNDRRVGHETDPNPNFYRIVQCSEEGQL
ncbi:hypothetical protein JST97_28500 [bacterium]|nr:hypothetical protein [bacterium]